MITLAKDAAIVIQGHNVLLQCNTHGQPTPEIVWAYGENYTKPIKEGSRYTLLPGGNLLIEETTVNDTGTLNCMT